MTSQISAIVLAGGKGTRMQSELPKVLHQIGEEPMIFHTLRKLQQLPLAEIIVVVGYKADQVKAVIEPHFKVKFAHQTEPLGTGHAFQTALDQLSQPVDRVLVVNGDDSAFYSIETLNQFMSDHSESESEISVITLEIDQDRPLGRIIRGPNGQFDQVMEKDRYQASGLVSHEINCGAYIINREWASKAVKLVKLNPKGEYFITDLLNIAKDQGDEVNLFKLADTGEWVGVNTQEDLARAKTAMLERLNNARA